MALSVILMLFFMFYNLKLVNNISVRIFKAFLI